jgi:hypothetical protein
VAEHLWRNLLYNPSVDPNDPERKPPMTAIETRLIERLKQLPPGRVAEVVDFVEFLAAREERSAAAARLGKAMAELDALGTATLSEDEVEEELQAAREARRQGA